MKPKTTDRLDPLANNMYERAMHPYWSLQAEADRERLLQQIPRTGEPRRSRVKASLTTCGSALAALGGLLVTLGLWLQTVAKR